MTPLTGNEYNVTPFYSTKKKIKQDFNVYMARLDVDSIFNTIPLGKNSDTSIDNLYDDNANTHKIPKNVSRNLLNIATNKSFFMFNNKFYKQIDGMAMGYPLGPALSNTFMHSFENKWLKDCPHGLKPVTDSMLMTYLYCFPFLIMKKSLKSINLPNNPT